jgi:hypothetical protein
MARRRSKRSMGPLLKEMRTNPLAALINGVLGIGSILGLGILIALRVARNIRRNAPGPATTEKSLLLYLGIGGIFLLGGIGFLLFAFLQITTSIRVYGHGLVWRRFGRKRVVFWIEVEHFSPGDAAAEDLTSWSMLLHGGERINFHSVLYKRREFEETMELMAEQIEETRKQY